MTGSTPYLNTTVLRTESILSFLRMEGYFTLQNNFLKVLWLLTRIFFLNPVNNWDLIFHIVELNLCSATRDSNLGDRNEHDFFTCFDLDKNRQNPDQTGHKGRKGQSNSIESNLLYQPNPAAGPIRTPGDSKFLWVIRGLLFWDHEERFFNSLDQRPNFFGSNIFLHYNFHLEILLKTHQIA